MLKKMPTLGQTENPSSALHDLDMDGTGKDLSSANLEPDFGFEAYMPLRSDLGFKLRPGSDLRCIFYAFRALPESQSRAYIPFLGKFYILMP